MSQTPVLIVPFQPAHYEALSEILSAIYPEHIVAPEGLQAQDGNLPAHCKCSRWVGCCEDVVVAFSEYRQTPEMYHPNRFTLNIAVRPDYQGRGIGSQLYRHLLSELRVFDPIALYTTVRSDSPYSAGFLAKRNFFCTMTVVEWWLDLRDVGAVDLESKFRAKKIEGISFHSVEDLSTDPERNRKLYDLITLLREDVPLPGSATPVDYPQFVARFLEHPNYVAEAAFVAVKANEFVGYSDLRDDGAGGLYGGLTGVRREYRRQGVGTALKLRGIRYACLNDYASIKTFNASENLPIRMINRNCGFVPQFEWMHYEQSCSHQPEEASRAASLENHSKQRRQTGGSSLQK